MNPKRYNSDYWKMSEGKRKAAYDQYVSWFNELKKTQEGMQKLVDGKRFQNCQRVRKRDGQWIANHFQPDSWAIFCFNTADPEPIIKAAIRKQLQNKEMIDEAWKHVDGNPNKPLLDPVFIQRAKNTKALREKLKTYTGSAENASDVLFAIKRQADSLGLDFKDAALDQVEKMQGPKEESTPEILEMSLKEPNKVITFVLNYRREIIIAALMLPVVLAFAHWVNSRNGVIF